jgi:iron complex outermembrane receptor protein
MLLTVKTRWLYLLLIGLVVCPARITAGAPQASEKSTAAQRPLASLSLEELATLQVTTVSKEPEEVSKTPAAIYVITNDEIRRSGVTSIADSLRLAPGVEVGRLSSTTWAIGMRGLQGNFSKSVLVLIDGRSVYTRLFAGVYWDVEDVILEDIDRIEVIRGPGGTIWGPNAVNGVVNIITKSAAATSGALASVTSGTLDHVIGQVRYGGAIGSGFNYRVYAKGFQRGPEFHSDHDNYDHWHQERTGFRMDWARGGDVYTFQGDTYKGDSPHQIGTTDVRDTVSGGNVLGRWRRQMSNNSDLYLATYFDRAIRIGSQLGETRNTIDLDFLHHLTLRTRHDFSWGGGLRWSPNRFLQKQPEIDLVPHDETDHVFSAFLQDEVRFTDRLSLTLGSKLEHTNFGGLDAQPSARVLWTEPGRQSLWGAVTRSVVTPSRLEEDFRLTGNVPGNPPVFLLVSGNPNFKSESVLSYELGYRRFVTRDLYLDFSAFRSDYRRLQSFGAPLITFETTPPPPHVLLTIPYGNAISGASYGGEIAPAWQAAPWWRMSGSYSFVAVDVRAKGPTSDISATGSVRTYEGSTPRHVFEIHSAVNLPKRFEFDQVLRYASALPAQDVKSYGTGDVRLGWNPNSNIQISLVGRNLFQPEHREWGTGDPKQTPLGVRRSAYIKIGWIR